MTKQSEWRRAMKRTGLWGLESVGIAALIGLLLVLWSAVAQGQPRWQPVGKSEPRAFYYPNAFADPLTGDKTGWAVPGSTRTPKYGMWQNQEHAILPSGTNRWTVVAMEINRAYLQNPGGTFVDAYKFMEYDDGIVDGDTTPTFQAGYWRGNTLSSHEYVWAPYVIENGGTYYLFYTAEDPDHVGWLACYLATSSTGGANPADWVQYDPNSGTPAIEPLFQGTNAGIKDFHVIRVNTSLGTRFYAYYIANPFIEDPENPGSQLGLSEVRLRISESLTDWSTKPETTVFSRTNVAETYRYRYWVDYENPEIIQYDDGSFYLFVSRHGQLPADYETNPNWTPIPLATEVYWSADGLNFDVADQLANLEPPSGRDINAAEIVRWNGRWFATHAQPSNQLANYEYDEPPDNPVTHSATITRLVQSLLEPENSLQIFEMEWVEITQVNRWVMYP